MDISFVIPLLNEEENLAPLYKEITSAMKTLNKEYEVIFVDDGSTDKTYEELQKLFEQNDNIAVIKFRRNFKKSAAYSAGFKLAQGDIIVTMDGDLQDDPADIPKLLKKVDEGYDMVCGWRYNRKDTTSILTASKLFNTVLSALSGLKLNDHNCPVKAYRKKVINDIKIYGDLFRFIPILSYKKGYKIGEAKISNRPRIHGKSKYGVSKIWQGLLDTITVLFITRYAERPLHFFGYLGLSLFFLGGGINIFVVIRKLLFGVLFSQSMGLLTLGVIVLSASFNLFAVGLILEFIISRTTGYEAQYGIETVLDKAKRS